MSQSTGPTLAGFNTFVYNVMSIDPLILPTNAPIIGYAYNVALGIANPLLAAAGCPAPGQWSFYAMAVYNLGGSNLINYAQDQLGRTWFADQRTLYGVTKFAPGVVSSTSDQSTATSLLNQDFMKTMTLRDLRTIKDPWGRQYMEIAQDFGPLWGLT